MLQLSAQLHPQLTINLTLDHLEARRLQCFVLTPLPMIRDAVESLLAEDYHVDVFLRSVRARRSHDVGSSESHTVVGAAYGIVGIL
jgi:hypothetical protein